MYVPTCLRRRCIMRLSDWVVEKFSDKITKGNCNMLMIIFLYILYIHPKLRILNFPSGPGKGAARFRGSTEGAVSEHKEALEER